MSKLSVIGSMSCQPGKADEMWRRLGGEELPSLHELPGRLPTSLPERWETVLFPRVDRDREQA